MNPRSFRGRLILLLMLVLVPSGALVLIANIERQIAEKERIREQAISAAKLAAASQDYYVKETRQLLATMTQFPFLVLLTNLSHSQTGLANLKLISPNYSDFGLIETDGTVFCHTLGASVTGHVILPSFVQEVLEKPGFAMSVLHPGPLPEQPALQFAYPIFDSDKKLARVMYASIKLPLLSAALADIHLPAGGSVSVMDKAGNVVAQHPAPETWVGKNLVSEPFVRRALAMTTNVFEAEGLEGVKRVFAVSAVMENQDPLLFVQVSVPQKILFAQADAQFGGSLVGLLLIGLLVLSLAWWFSKRAFLRPVAAMLSATERITQGDLSSRTGISKGKSELHILAQRFDVMAETLARRRNELEHANAEVTKSNAELEQRVLERTSELQTLNSELEAFSYSVSHDLRAPLRHMDGFAQLLASDESMESNASAKRYLGLITKSAKQMGTLIDDLLSFSKMSRQAMTVVSVNTEEIVREVIAEAGLEAPGREILWKIDPLPRAPADAALIRLVWRNLISNAVKYTRGKEPARIEISAQTGNGETVFTVADNGAGFDMRYADKLFGVFQRLHPENEFEGTGIGLANVRRIVHRHGGRTWAEAEPGNGARFFFSLPIHLS